MKADRSRLPILFALTLGATLTALTLIFPQIGFLEWFIMIPLIIGVYHFCDAPDCTPKRAYG